jgi:bifunctional non-homologous end joining protein LigD
MADRLRDYEAKRDFAKTPEPAGAKKRARKAKAPRFVVQEHSATRLHWDLRLERDGALVSFAIPNALPPEPGRNHLAVHTEDHPLQYLDFEGEIPKGEYGAGTMSVWDRGTYEVLKWEPRKIEVHLHGERVDARYALFPLDKGEDPKDWMIHRMDPAEPGPGGAAPEAMPEKIVPMMARAGKLPSARDDARFAYEIKWDGVRAICHSEPGTLRLHSRNLNEITKRYPELARLNRALSHHRVVLDGEIVAFGDDGRPSFGALQRRMHLGDERQVKRIAAQSPVTYVIFDLLWIDGPSRMGETYEARTAALAELGLEGPRWQAPGHVVGNGAKVLDAAREQGLEGIVAKRLDCPYEPGKRSPGWIKVKLVQRQELVVCGWMPGEGRRRERIGALLLGVHEDGGLRYAGRVGTGFTDAELTRLQGLLGPREREDPPFTAPGPAKLPKGAVWVDPDLVAEIEFLEWTSDGQLRAPSYKGLRDDKPAIEVVSETKAAAMLEVDGREVRLSNPDKVLYPATGFAKRDLVDYLLAVASVLLPHLEDRPLTLKRYPNGVEGKFFYEKRAPSHRPDWVQTAPVRERGGIDQYVVAADRPTLAWLGNLADLELHTPMARADDLERPTILAFDLDPGAPATAIECCQVALWLKGMFEGLGLQCFPKTSGSKGVQVYVPLNHPDATYAQTKAFARSVAEVLEREAPELVVSRQTKTLRGGKVLVDWSQNDQHKTTVCVYSPRAKDRPTVSTPLTWDEVSDALDGGDPAALEFDTVAVLERVEREGDLFAPVVSLVQELPG